jgi:uncharacterized protein YunC (DUF1805 family)
VAEPDFQTEVLATPRGRVMAMDSAYHVGESNRQYDVVVAASYCGVLPARFVGSHNPRALIGVDCGIGPEGASIAGLWFLEALNIPAVATDVDSVILGDGVDVYLHGVVSRINRPASDCGVISGMTAVEAARLMLESDPGTPDAVEVTNRQVVYESDTGRQVVCTDSIAFALPEDRVRNVLVTAGHTGRSAVPYLEKAMPYGFICSDGGMGRENAGAAGLKMVESLGLPGATVDAQMGSGLSTYFDGIVSASNRGAEAAGVRVGMTAREAARLLVECEHAEIIGATG